VEGEVRVAVRDDGKGIAEGVEALAPGSIGIGLGGMSQRAKELGGKLKVRNLNPGTLLEVVIPCAARDVREVRTAV